MRKFINIALAILGIISSIFLLKFSTLPVICFPDFFVTSPETRETYSLVYNICLGLLLSILFYFIVNIVPECIKIRKSKKLIHTYIEQILENMNLIISLSFFIHKREDISIRNIANKDLNFFNGLTCYAHKEFSYSINSYNIKTKQSIGESTGIHTYATFNKIVKSSIVNIKENIEYVKKYEYFYSVNETMVEALRRIELCKFIDLYGNENNDCYIFSHTDKDIYEFISLYRLLEKQKYNEKYSIVTVDSEDETEKYREKRNNGTYINYIISCTQKRNEKYAYYNPVLIVPNSYNSRLVSEKFSKQFSINTYMIESEKFEFIENKDVKLCICIVSKETVESFSNLLSSIDFPVKVFIIYECELIKRHFPLKISSDTINIIKKYTYLKNKYLFNKKLLLNKEHPTDKEIDTIIKEIQDYILEGVEYDTI